MSKETEELLLAFLGLFLLGVVLLYPLALTLWLVLLATMIG